ncbi:MAG: 30S ribosome-binding factor RbfA [Clostridia bacterium]|nr:30S ribosome-binding factor RbfA [Clostridia bacterium]
MGYRLARESSEILKELTLIIQNKLRNPNIDQMLTLTGVELSKDVKYADIFVSSFSDEQNAVDILNKSAGFLRHELSLSLRHFRTIPILRFHVDESRAYGEKIDKILKEINERSDN